MIFQYYLKTKKMNPLARNLFSLLCHYCDTWPDKIQGIINYGLLLKIVHHGVKVWWQDNEWVRHILSTIWESWRWIFSMISPSFLCVHSRSSNWYSASFIPVRFHLTSLERTHRNVIYMVFWGHSKTNQIDTENYTTWEGYYF